MCKGVHCVDLSESFPTHIYLQNLASIQPRTNPVKFARSRTSRGPTPVPPRFPSLPTKHPFPRPAGGAGRTRMTTAEPPLPPRPGTTGAGGPVGPSPVPPRFPGTFSESGKVSKIGKISNFFLQNFANFWRARSRLYQNEILQENMRSTAFFKLYKICILLHRCDLKILAKNRLEKSAILVKIQQKFWRCCKFCKFCQFSKMSAW